MQGLYQFDMNSSDKLEILEFILSKIKENEANEEISIFIKENFLGAIENLSFIDDLIVKKSKNWHLDRINKVDKSILRLAIFELFFRSDIPESVSINEAIEIAKKYSTKDSSKFINGILGAVAKEESINKNKFVDKE